jgi:hypothetical protein
MVSFESPVKLDPSNPKKKRENISWDKIHKCKCQRVSLEHTVNMRDVGKSSFVEAMSTRKDSVFEKVIQELTCLENVYSTDVKIVYHPSCYRSYTSKRNCRVFKVEHNLTDPAEYPYDKQYENKLNKVQTRSLLPTVTVDINTCSLCKKKDI